MNANQTLLPHMVTVTSTPHPDAPNTLWRTHLTRRNDDSGTITVTVTMPRHGDTVPDMDDVMLTMMRRSNARRVDPVLTPHEWEQWAQDQGYPTDHPHALDMARTMWEMFTRESAAFTAWLPEA